MASGYRKINDAEKAALVNFTDALLCGIAKTIEVGRTGEHDELRAYACDIVDAGVELIDAIEGGEE